MTTTTIIRIKYEDDVKASKEYLPPTVVPIPLEGELVGHPDEPGYFFRVKSRSFEYGEGRIIVTLNC